MQKGDWRRRANGARAVSLSRARSARAVAAEQNRKSFVFLKKLIDKVTPITPYICSKEPCRCVILEPLMDSFAAPHTLTVD